MREKLIKIISIIITGILGFIILGFTIYVILYYPRKADSFEITSLNPTKKLLIATQGSEYKNLLVKALCDSLNNSNTHIKGIDIKRLKDINPGDWDVIVIITSFIIQLNKHAQQFIKRTESSENILIYVTSGGADWIPEPELLVDAITSASRKENMTVIRDIIISQINSNDIQKWQNEDYLLALRYYSQVDVASACDSIAINSDYYNLLYPNMVDVINSIGYLYIRQGRKRSALDIFSLNITLFPKISNVYDSYGEALILNGEPKMAIKNYKKALELNPGRKSAEKALKKLGSQI